MADVIVKVTGVNLNNDSAIDPSASTLQMGFTPSANGPDVPPPALWVPGTWITNTLRELFYAMCLATQRHDQGSNVAVLTVGTWIPWVWFTLGAATIQRPCGDTVTVVA